MTGPLILGLLLLLWLLLLLRVWEPSLRNGALPEPTVTTRQAGRLKIAPARPPVGLRAAYALFLAPTTLTAASTFWSGAICGGDET